MKRFKTTLAILTSALALVIMVPAISFAQEATPGTTYVAGKVTQNGSPVSGASVTVTCDTHVLSSTTTSDGGYLVQYAAADCPDGTTATATATKGAAAGTGSGPVDNLAANVNLAIVPVSIVPELGVVTGITTAVLAGGAFMVIRRRQLGGHTA